MASIYGDTARGPMSPFFFDKFYGMDEALDPEHDEVMVGRYVIKYTRFYPNTDYYDGIIYQKVYLNGEYDYMPIMRLTAPNIGFDGVQFYYRREAMGKEEYYDDESTPIDNISLTSQGGTNYTLSFSIESIGDAIMQMWNMVAGEGELDPDTLYKIRNIDTTYYDADSDKIDGLNYDETNLVGSINSLHKALGFLFKTVTEIPGTDEPYKYIYIKNGSYWIKRKNNGTIEDVELDQDDRTLYGTLLKLYELIGTNSDYNMDTIKGCINLVKSQIANLVGMDLSTTSQLLNRMYIDFKGGTQGSIIGTLTFTNNDRSILLSGNQSTKTITLNGGNNCSIIPSNKIAQIEGVFVSDTWAYINLEQTKIFKSSPEVWESLEFKILETDGTITSKSFYDIFTSVQANRLNLKEDIAADDLPTVGSYLIFTAPVFYGDITADSPNFYTSAIGNNTQALEVEGQRVIGKYNKPNLSALFQVGNGNASTRSNAFEVLQNGTVLISNVDETNVKSAVTIQYLNEHSGTSNRSKGSFQLNGITYYYTVDAGIRFDIWCKIQEYVNTSALNNHNDSHAINLPWDEAIGQSQNINMNSVGVQVCLDSSGDNQNLFEYCGAPFGEISDDNKLVYGAVIARYDELKKAYPRSSGNTTYIKYNVHITGQFND